MTLLELLPLERPLICLDLETTGPNPREDRIVELGFILLKPDGTTKEWQSFVNPGISIPSEATYGNPEKGFDGHGITDEMVQGCSLCRQAKGNCPEEQPNDLPPGGHFFRPWPSFRQLAESLLRGFKDCDYGGYNVKNYDLPLLQAEFQRAGHSWSYADARILDGFRLWQVGRRRTLSDAVEEFLGEQHDGAHRALDDVRASLRVIAAQLQKFPALPRDLTKLHELQWPRDPNALTPDGKIVWRKDSNGWTAVMNFGKNWTGKRLDLMTRRDLEWIVSPACQGASAEVKRVCQNARDGKFPVKEETE